MKRRIFAMTMIMVLVMSIVGCGSETVTEKNPTNKNETEVNVEVEPTTEPTNEPVVEPTSEPIEDNTTNENGVVDSGTIEDVLGTNDNETSVSATVHYDYDSEQNGDNVVIWQDVTALNDGSNMAKHVIHFTNSKGYPMTYSMIGSDSMCNNAYISANEGTTCCIYDNNYELRMWGCNFESGDSISDYDMNTVTTWSYGTYIEDTYQVEKTDEFCRIIFKVDFEGTKTGYACYIDYYDTMEGYQFEYLESNDVFDDERALSVVQSIERVEVTE